MRYYTVLFCIVCVIMLPSPGHTADPGDIYLRYLEGDVQVKTENAKEWLPASINMPLTNSDQIWVPDNGRAEVFLRNGTIVRLDKNTFLEMPAPGDKRTRFYLGAGRVYGNAIVEKGNAVALETPAASFTAYASSIFRIDVAENEDSTVSVFQGELYADLGTGQMRIGAGEKIVLKKNAQYPVLAKLSAADEWEQWNKQRDRELSGPGQGNATAYLPDELKAYSYDLNKNGRWVYEQEYGYVWTPTVIVVQNWSPYRVGRWVWMRGDYVWISYEPWGWAPYHYGRWAFVKARGWCWVPPRRGFSYWGPGYVGWVYTPTYVSWVPLAPGEIYYGRGYYGPYSVNIKNVTVQNITAVRPVYKNIHVDHAVTTLHRDAFTTGRHAQLTAKENLFLKEKRVMASPEKRPGKETAMPVIKDIPQAKQPPSRIVSQGLRTSRNNDPSPKIQNRTNAVAVSSVTMNPIKRMDGKKTGVQQQGAPPDRTRALAESRSGNQLRYTAKEAMPVTERLASVPRRVPSPAPQAQTPAAQIRPRVAMVQPQKTQQAASILPQARPAKKPSSAAPQAQPAKKDDMQVQSAFRDMPSREALPRADQRRGR